MTKTINWGILGLGKIAEKFGHDIQFVPDAQLYAVGSRDIGKAKSFAQKFNSKKAFGSYEEMLADKELDVVYIATPHVFHCENTLQCLRAGKAVLCEKPFAMDVKQVHLMIDEARKQNLFLMEALWTRFLPTILKVEELIANGVLGEINHIKSDFGNKAPYDINWRLFNKQLGGGSLLDIGIYPVYIALQILGVPDNIISEACVGAAGVDESMVMAFTYKNGATASLSSSFMANTPVETDICGTKARVRIHRMWHIPSYLTLTNNEGDEHEYRFEYKGFGYEYEAMEVTKCLLEGKKESEKMSLDFSLKLIRILDIIRLQNNLIY
jgi:predicted dehydrogenase